MQRGGMEPQAILGSGVGGQVFINAYFELWQYRGSGLAGMTARKCVSLWYYTHPPLKNPDF